MPSIDGRFSYTYIGASRPGWGKTLDVAGNAADRVNQINTLMSGFAYSKSVLTLICTSARWRRCQAEAASSSWGAEESLRPVLRHPLMLGFIIAFWATRSTFPKTAQPLSRLAPTTACTAHSCQAHPSARIRQSSYFIARIFDHRMITSFR